MPRITHPATGQPVYIPGVYTDTDVVSDLPGPLPAFMVPMVLADAEEGYPITIETDRFDHETVTWWKFRGTASSSRDWFGADSDMATVMAWAKRNGLPNAYCVAINPLTRAKVVATSVGPINQVTIAARKFGAPGGHIKIKCTGGATPTLEVTPLKHYSRLTATAAIAATTIYVRDNSWVRDGMTISIGDATSANVDMIVDSTGTSLDSDGQVLYWVKLTSALAAEQAIADYAMIVEYDDTAMEAPDAFTTVAEMVTWIQESSEYLEAKTEVTFSGAAIIVLATATPIKDVAVWAAPTDGTSPASTSTEYDDFITLIDATGWDEFAESEQVVPQAFYAATDSSTAHGALRDWAIAKRAEGYPVSITTGVGWGDVVLDAGNDTDPKFRLAALNSQDVCLCVGGIDKLASYLTLGPSVYGRRVGGGIPHNLTNDDMFYSEVEVKWDERGSGELTALHRAGACTYRLSMAGTIRYRISQGLSSLQSNASAWNESTADTCLLMQRDLADYVERIMRTDLDMTQVGADEVSPGTIGAVIIRRADKLVKRGLITGYTITSITLNDSGAGYDVDWRLSLPTTNDFITLRTTIYIGEE